RQAPRIGRLRVSRSGRRTIVSFTLSEPARVALVVQRRTAGRRSRHVALGTLVRRGVEGRNRIVLGARIGRRALRPGAYRLRVRAVDAAGNRPLSPLRRFRIVTPPTRAAR
ncbi:MAG: hypothetical protein ACKVWR_15435, partial [Acidimicrobiales bacterium]